ncbi:MAG: DedD protein [Cellvibrionaceae bacterium]|jgi:DedD protein
MVIVALGIIFLPSFFQKDKRSPLETESEIPPALVIEPVIVAPPVRPDNVLEPDNQSVFQPELMEEDNLTSGSPVGADNSIDSGKARLTESGVPVGWVVQIASFKSKDSAEKLTQDLIESDFKAYSKPVFTSKGEFFRVFIGPFIDKEQALKTKRTVDRDYQMDARVLRFNPASGN